MEEIWKDIKGYEGLYQISNFGRVKRLIYANNFNGKSTNKLPDIFKCNKILKKYITSNGYERIMLCKNGARKRFMVHKLVAQAFIPNPLNKTQINHINGIKTDNKSYNLEWCTPRENLNHAYKNGLKPKSSNCFIKGHIPHNIQYITFGCETHTIKEWSEITGIKATTLKTRLNKLKWDTERALTEEVQNYKNKKMLEQGV